MLSNYKTSHDKENILKEFDLLTLKGYECVLTELWQENGKGWYTSTLKSVEQNYFNKKFKKYLRGLD